MCRKIHALTNDGANDERNSSEEGDGAGHFDYTLLARYIIIIDVVVLRRHGTDVAG